MSRGPHLILSPSLCGSCLPPSLSYSFLSHDPLSPVFRVNNGEVEEFYLIIHPYVDSSPSVCQVEAIWWAPHFYFLEARGRRSHAARGGPACRRYGGKGARWQFGNGLGPPPSEMWTVRLFGFERMRSPSQQRDPLEDCPPSTECHGIVKHLQTYH